METKGISMTFLAFAAGFVVGSFFPQPTVIRNIYTTIKNKLTGK